MFSSNCMKAVKVVFVCIMLLLALYACSSKTPEAEPSAGDKVASAVKASEGAAAKATENASAPAKPVVVQPSGEGAMYVGIADAAISVNDVSKLEVTINAIQLRQAGSGNITKLGTGIKSFDLLRLRKDGVTAFFGNETIPAGTYDQLRIFVGDVNVVYKGQDTEAKLPSSTLKIDANFEVPVNGTSSIVLDFQADQSLHITGQGRIILAPVIQLNHAVGASVQVVGSELKITGGNERIGKLFGMELDGNMGEGKKIDAIASLSYENGKVVLASGSVASTSRILTGNVGNVTNAGESSTSSTTNASGGGVIISKGGGNPTNVTNPAGTYRTYRRIGNYSNSSSGSSQAKYY